MLNTADHKKMSLALCCLATLMMLAMTGTAMANADLIPVGFDLVGSEVAPGEALETRLYGSVANMTDAGVGPFQVAFFITQDTTDPSTSQLLDDGIDDVSGVPPYDTVEVPIVGAHAVPSDWPVGPAWLVMKVDYGNNIPEIYEHNNAAFLPVDVNYPISTDTTVVFGSTLPDEWHAVPLKTADYSGLGCRFVHPSPVDTVWLDRVMVPLYKEPGTSFDPSLNLAVRIMSLNDDMMPSELIAIDTLYGADIAQNWAIEDSLKEVWLDLVTDKSTTGLTLPPGVSCAMMVSQLPGSSGVVLVPADHHFVSVDDDPIPGSLTLGIAAYKLPGGGVEYRETGTVNFGAFEITATRWICTPILDSVDIRWMDHFIHNFPYENPMLADINDLWLFRTNPFSGLWSIDQLDIVIGNDFYSFPRDESAWDTLGYVAFSDNGMMSHPSGEYLVTISLNGCELFRDEFFTESRPLMDAPWADLDLRLIDYHDNNGLAVYQILADIPPEPLGFTKDFKILGKNFHNELSLQIHANQQWDSWGLPLVTWHSGAAYLEIMGYELIPYDAIPDIYAEEDGDIFRAGFTPYTFDLGDMVIYDGRIWQQEVAPGILSIKVDALLGIKGALSVTGQVSMPPEPLGSMTVTPSLTPYAGIEAEASLLLGAAKVGVGATGLVELQFPCTISFDPPDATMDFCMDFDVDYWYWVKVFGKTVASGKGSKELYNGCDDKASEDSLPTFSHDSQYFGSSTSVLSNDADRLMTAFIHNDENKGDQVWYSVNQGGYWSAPQPATESERPKSDVKVAAYGDNSFAAIWVENNADVDTVGFDNDSLLAAIGDQDIYVSIYDATNDVWQPGTPLTVDDQADGMPVIAGTEDRLYAAWVRNENTAAFDKLSMRIYTATCIDGIWGDPHFIPDQDGFNMQPDIAIDPATNEAMIVWTCDLDGDPFTPLDRELKSVRLDASGEVVVGSAEDVTSATSLSYGPATPSLAFDYYGRPIVAYECYGFIEDSLGQLSEPAGFGHNINIGFSRRVTGSTWISNILDSAGTSPEIAVDSDGNIHLGYRSFADDSQTTQDGEVAYLVQEIGSPGVWSDPEYKTDDTLTTFIDDVVIDQYGNPVMFYRNDSLTGDFLEGMDKIYTTVAALINTPIGAMVDFVLGDGTRLTFEQVDAAGHTADYFSYLGPALDGYEIIGAGKGGVYHHITTTAEFSGNVHVETGYEELAVDDTLEAQLVLLHYDGTSWENITTEVDTVTNTITGVCTSLSPFVVAVPTSCCRIVGDINHDGSNPDIADLVRLVNYMFSGGTEIECLEEADVNGDGSGPDIADLVHLVNFMFSGGPAPVACGQVDQGLAKLIPVSEQSSLNLECRDGVTRVILNSTVDLRGLQLELRGHGATSVIKLCDNDVDLVAGIEPEAANVGMLDLDGSAPIFAGRYELLELDGAYNLVMAIAVDTYGRTVYLSVAKGSGMPDDYVLDPNYPNPFNPATTIGFSLPRASEVRLDVFNLLGQKVTTLVDGYLDAGHHQAVWNGQDANGAPSASGVYFYRLATNDFKQSRKMMLLK